MSLEQPHRLIGRAGPGGRKTLALFVVFVLSAGAFVLAAGEARAQQQQQQHPTPKAYAAATGPERMPVTRVGDAGIEATPASPSRAEEREFGPPSRPEPVPQTSGEAGPAPALPEEPDFAPAPDFLPGPTMPEDFGIFVEPAPALLEAGPMTGPQVPVPFADSTPAFGPMGFGLALGDPGFVPGPGVDPVFFGESRPLWSQTGERLPVLSPAGSPQGVRTAPLPGNGPEHVSLPVVPPPPGAGRTALAPAVPEPPTPAPPDPSGEASLLRSGLEVASGAVETLQGAASTAAGAAAGVPEALATGDNGSTGSSSGEAEESSPEAPSSPSPSPLGGHSFSLYGAGQIGAGSAVPLLVGILAAGLILLRPAGRLLWAACERPKPSSALLVPLERPG